jgi:putative sigma-54 modulation protein
MQVLYTGLPQDFSELEQKKINAKIAKVSKLVDGRGGEKGLHVFFQTQRHLTKAEVTLNYYGHSAAGAATDPDAFRALTGALEKLEKQVSKVRGKWRDTKRTPVAKPVAAPVEPTPPNPDIPRVTRVQVPRKPMTVDEALLVIDRDAAYLPFRDMETGSVSVLIRRNNGTFDLIET